MKARVHHPVIRPQSEPTERGAFTLIELSVVLVLVGLLVAVATLKMREPYRAAKFKAVNEQIVQFNQLARSHAKRHNTNGQIAIDVENGNLMYSASSLKNVRRVHLDNVATIDQVYVNAAEQNPYVATISVSQRGRTPTYAVGLTGSQGEKNWLIFAGPTGQVLRFEDGEEFRAFRDDLFHQQAHE